MKVVVNTLTGEQRAVELTVKELDARHADEARAATKAAAMASRLTNAVARFRVLNEMIDERMGQ